MLVVDTEERASATRTSGTAKKPLRRRWVEEVNPPERVTGGGVDGRPEQAGIYELRGRSHPGG